MLRRLAAPARRVLRVRAYEFPNRKDSADTGFKIATYTYAVRCVAKPRHDIAQSGMVYFDNDR